MKNQKKQQYTVEQRYNERLRRYMKAAQCSSEDEGKMRYDCTPAGVHDLLDIEKKNKYNLCLDATSDEYHAEIELDCYFLSRVYHRSENKHSSFAIRPCYVLKPNTTLPEYLEYEDMDECLEYENIDGTHKTTEKWPCLGPLKNVRRGKANRYHITGVVNLSPKYGLQIHVKKITSVTERE